MKTATKDREEGEFLGPVGVQTKNLYIGKEVWKHITFGQITFLFSELLFEIRLPSVHCEQVALLRRILVFHSAVYVMIGPMLVYMLEVVEITAKKF